MELILISASLAMDAFAVSLSQNINSKNNSLKYMLILGAVFGCFQFIMPCIGYSVGSFFSDKIIEYGSLISSIILIGIGVNMLKDAITHKSNENLSRLTLKTLMILGIITSIDALAVGLSFSLEMKKNILSLAFLSGAITFLLSVAGGYLGNRLSTFLEKKAKYFGGIILILLGIKSLL